MKRVVEKGEKRERPEGAGGVHWVKMKRGETGGESKEFYRLKKGVGAKPVSESKCLEWAEGGKGGRINHKGQKRTNQKNGKFGGKSVNPLQGRFLTPKEECRAQGINAVGLGTEKSEGGKKGEVTGRKKTQFATEEPRRETQIACGLTTKSGRSACGPNSQRPQLERGGKNA